MYLPVLEYIAKVSVYYYKFAMPWHAIYYLVYAVLACGGEGIVKEGGGRKGFTARIFACVCHIHNRIMYISGQTMSAE